MVQLNCKERLYNSAHKKDVDRKPCICPGGMMNMIMSEAMILSNSYWPEAHSDADKMANLCIALNKNGGFENYGVPFCMTVEAESMGADVNMGNKLCEPHVVGSLLNSVENLQNLKLIDINKGRVKTVLDSIKILKSQNNDVPIVGNITGPISVGGTLLDMSILLKEFRKKPEASMKYLDFICENLSLFAQAQINAGADVICISEPSGTGEILGPKFFEEYTVRCLNKILDNIDVPTKIVHICGNLKSVYSSIKNIHSDVFSFDAVVPIKDIKQYLPNHAAMGNISTFAIGTMPKEKISELVNFALKKDVDIVSPACGLPISTPLINVQTMVETVKEERTNG